MIAGPRGHVLVILVFSLVGCAAPKSQLGTGASALEPLRVPTALHMVINTEVINLATRAVGPTSPARTTRLFNTGLTIVDAQTTVRPNLVEEMPQLDSDSRRVFPDGRMETTWRLQPNLAWHVGQSLTADNVVLASAEREQLHAIILNAWPRTGIAAQPMVMSGALEWDQQVRATFAGVLEHSIEVSKTSSGQALASEEFATPANRWSGSNRSGGTNSEYELLWEWYNGTLNRTEQDQAFIQKMRLPSGHLPIFPHSNFITVTAYVPRLRGAQSETSNWIIHG
ncbi:MAG TPA: hypothetical protein VNL18_01265 [Gemmatimonadales bacterium]|nr:hypothetical protein [Gemmatimonadales bacterium]